MKSSAVLFDRLGPYHHARLRAAGRLGDVTAIEVSANGGTYAWRRVAGADSFKKVTLFEKCDSDSRPGGVEVARRVRVALEEASPDTVFVPGWSDVAALAALDWCCTTRTPAVLMSDSQEVDRPRVWWREVVKRRLVSLFSAALAGGTPHLDYLVQLGVPREHIFTGYDVVDNAYFEAGAEAARADSQRLRARLALPERYFLASNRFIEKKNLPRLLQAYAQYRGAHGPKPWKLVLLGDGELRPQLTDLRRALTLDGDVLMPGFKQYDELPAYYGLARAFIHASTTEQWGLVVNEAMASGLPVLVSNRCGCAPDLVREERNGFTFDPYDVDALAGHMLKMAGGEYDLAAMGRASREIISHWTPEAFADGLLNAAEAALAAPRIRAGPLGRALLWGLVHR